MADRWASFDCYGTLVDWNAGIRGQLERLFGPERADGLLERYHELEPLVQASRFMPYRDVLRLALALAADAERLSVPEGEEQALAESLPSWPVFPEVPGALREARERGWRLAILSNSDRDLIEASQERIHVPFDLAIVAGQIGSYKPAHGHWERFYAESGAEPERHVHVAQSHFHDVVPAGELGILSVWVNRLGEAREPPPTREIQDLAPLPDTLDELVPA
jgi:2-haloacid dehalogenase